MKINQQTVDLIMFGKMEHIGDYSDLDTLERIRAAVRKKFGVNLSNAEAHMFWRWRSEKYDANFLVCEKDDQIVEWFGKFVSEWYEGDSEEEFMAPYEMKKEEK